jgi:uncharacterized protein
MKIFHHNDSDGFCSAYWVRQAIFSKIITDYSEGSIPEVLFVECTYPFEFDIDLIKENETIIIVDYSVEPEVMDKLLQKTPNICWIDHHISSFQKYSNYKQMNKIKGFQYNVDKSMAACALVYLYFFENCRTNEEFELNYEKVPYFTRLISDYDCWKKEYKNLTNCFFLYINAQNQAPDSTIWDILNKTSKEDINKLAKSGELIQQYLNISNDLNIKNYAFETKFEGHSALCINSCTKGSTQFGKNINKYDCCITFSFDGKKWNYGIYSTKIDVSEIAKKFGGGGHRGASGYSTEKLILGE